MAGLLADDQPDRLDRAGWPIHEGRRDAALEQGLGRRRTVRARRHDRAQTRGFFGRRKPQRGTRPLDLALNLAIVALGLLVSTAIGLAMARSVGKRIRAGEDTLGVIRKILEDEPAGEPELGAPAERAGRSGLRPVPKTAILPNRGLVLLPRPSDRKPTPSFCCFAPKLRLLDPIHEEV